MPQNELVEGLGLDEYPQASEAPIAEEETPSSLDGSAIKRISQGALI